MYNVFEWWVWDVQSWTEVMQSRLPFSLCEMKWNESGDSKATGTNDSFMGVNISVCWCGVTSRIFKVPNMRKKIVEAKYTSYSIRVYTGMHDNLKYFIPEAYTFMNITVNLHISTFIYVRWNFYFIYWCGSIFIFVHVYVCQVNVSFLRCFYSLPSV